MGFSLLVIGLIFGSFLNVLIYRLPKHISLFRPKRSFCTKCKHQINWYENIPLVSFLFLKGKCPHCNNQISIRYPIVELLAALVTTLIYYQFGLSLDFVVLTLLCYTLIVLSFIDYEYKAVPDYLLIIVLVITLFFSKVSFSSLLMFAGGFVLLELIITFYIQNIKYKITKDEALLTQKSMGEGDVPIAAIIGGVLGIEYGIIAIVFGAFFAIIHSLFNMLIKKEIETPFIPYLSLGFFVVLVSQNHLHWILP